MTRALASCALFAVLSATALTAGCDQVGAPLVDQHNGKGVLPTIACPDTPACVPPPDAGARALRRAEPLDLSRCGNYEPLPECAADAGTPAATGDLGEAGDFDGGMPDDLQPHGGDAIGVPDSPQPCAGDVVELPRQLSCERAISRNAPREDRQDQTQQGERLQDARWRDLDLTLASDSPRKVVLAHPNISNAFIELRGPLTLRIEDTDQVSSLTISGRASEAGVPRIELVGVWGSGLVIGDQQHPFPGTVDARDARFSALQIFADELSAESSALEDGVIDVRMVTTSDVELTDLAVAQDRGVFSASRLHTIEFTRCTELTFAGSHVFGSNLLPCSGNPVRVFDSSFSEGWLDGVFEGSEAHFAGVVFGTREPTELQMWFSKVTNAAFCDQVERWTMAGAAGVECTFCPSDTFVPETVCALPKAHLDFKTNPCPGLDKDATLPRCEPPLPVSHRAIGPL